MIAISYTAYLLLSIAITVLVARTLHRNGRIFLVDSFLGNETLADSVNQLLLVGFYLVNVGYVSLTLRYGVKPWTLEQAIEYISTRIGFFLLILGFMHFVNIKVLASMRGPVRPPRHTAPPVGA